MTEREEQLAQKEKAYLQGYRSGFQDGLAAGASGNTAFPHVLQLPVEALGLSTPALYCLQEYGCVRIADVAELSLETIYAMPNMGRKRANEVARSLCAKGIFPTAWDGFLL